MRFLSPDIRALDQQYGRQTRSKPGRSDPVQRSTRDFETFGRPRHQRCQRIDVLCKRLPKRRDRGAQIGHHALLLRNVEFSAGTCGQPRTDGLQNAARARNVFVRGTDAILRRKNLKIGVGGRRKRRQRDHVPIETARSCGFLC